MTAARLPALAALLTAFAAMASGAEQRFPPPEFEAGHQLPVTTTPAARASLYAWLDVGVLVAALALATWLVYRRRSRRGVLGVAIFSLLYFGFWREGCICTIGSIQNVALALADKAYAVPLTAAAFFLLPLLVAVFFGRTFCAAVCPHGALQELVLLRPIQLPRWLDHGLGLLAYVYLGAAVLFAATGSAFVICRYDPFVPLFRLSGSFGMLLLGGAFLLLAMFVGRPYCRFLCPYGALLRLTSRLSKWQVSITPDTCTRCRLCEDACPYGAIVPAQLEAASPRQRTLERRQLAWLLALLPVLVAGGTLLGAALGPAAARVHPSAGLAARYDRATVDGPLDPADAVDDPALLRAAREPAALFAEAARLERRFVLGTALLGAWTGLVVGARLIGPSLRRRLPDYIAHRTGCVACARCYDACPEHLASRGLVPPDDEGLEAARR